MKKALFSSLAIMFFTFCLLPDTNQLIIQRVDTSLYPEMKVFLSVLDGGGKVILGLKAENFQIIENNIEVKNFKAASVFKNMEWLAVSLVMDRSGSMTGKSMAEAKKAAQEFIGDLGLGDRVALVTFNHELQLASDFIQEKEKVIEIVSGITPKNNTALYDAILFAIDGIKKQAAPRKAVVVLTDGKDTASKAGIGECLAVVKESRIPVFIIGLGCNLNEEILKKITLASGGNYFSAPLARDLLEIYHQIALQLETQYVLLYRSIALDAKGIGTLQVNLRRGDEIVYDRRYFSLVRDHPVNLGAMAAVTQIPSTTAASQKAVPSSEAYFFFAMLFGLGGGIIGLILAILLITISKINFSEKNALKALILFLSILMGALSGVLVYFMKFGRSSF